MNSKQNNDLLLFGKVPPQDIEAERSVLGALLIDAKRDGVLSSIIKIIDKNSFYSNVHQDIYEAIISLYDKNLDIDNVTVAYELKKNDKLDSSGGVIYLTELTEKVATSLHIISHAAIIQENYILRMIINVCTNLIKKSYEREVDVEQLIILFEREIKTLEEKAKRSLPNKQGNQINDILEKMFRIKEIGYNEELLKTGNIEIDNVIDISPKEIIFVAGPPKSTKTRNIVNVMHLLAKRHSDVLNVLWYCMEDSIEDIIKYRISIETGIDGEVLDGKVGHLTSEDMVMIKSVKDDVVNDFIEMVDRPTDIETIARHFKSFVKKDKHNILIIDNFNMCTDRVTHIKDQTGKEIFVSSAIQSVTSYLNSEGFKVTIIVLDHLSKEQSYKANIIDAFRPKQSHLKGSERKFAILTQLVMVNKPGEHNSLLAEEASGPDVKINNKYWKRKDLLASEDGSGLIILEKVASRKSRSTGESKIARIYAHIGKMNFINLKDI